MKTFFVKTQSSLNAHRLHSIDKVEFSTIDYAEAAAVFEKEVAALANEYVTADYFDYPINDRDCEQGVYCSIIAIDNDDPDNIEFIKDSELFYEK